ncbi:MAG: hypothetical protein Q8K60_04610 [Parachlamydiaceae bacterium]|nr:hypothetical protein [Parachlamydiaceae bacterium]
MDNTFKIYVEQLREGREEKFSEQINPDFIDIHDNGLEFKSPIFLSGNAYLAENELIIHWNISTEALLPCSICNEWVTVPINIENFYHCESLNEIKTGIFDFKNLLRETILIETPLLAECNQGNCPKRKEYSKYLKNSSNSTLKQDDEYHPFANL